MKKLRILFDARPIIDSRKSGIGYYVAHLLENLSQEYSEQLELQGFYFNFLGRNKNSKFTKNDPTISFKASKIIPGKLIPLLRKVKLNPYLEYFASSKADVLLFTNYVSLPSVRKTPNAIIVYDMGYLDCPDYVQDKNLKYLVESMPASINNAELIITISEFTKKRILHYFPQLNPDNIIVTHIPPVDQKIEHLPLNDRLLNLGVTLKKYILYLGTIEPRKNISNLLDAYAQLSPNMRAEYSLVLAGGSGWKDEAIIQKIKDYTSGGLNIILTGYVSDKEKSTLYSNALLFIFPSHYEGFGMPILEAMQYDVPVAASNIEIFHEVAGGAIEYFDKDDYIDMANSISKIIENPTLRSKMVANGSELLKKYSWKDICQIVYKGLQKIKRQ